MDAPNNFDRMGDIALQLLPYLLRQAGFNVTRSAEMEPGEEVDMAKLVAIGIVGTIITTATAARITAAKGVPADHFIRQISGATGVSIDDLNRLARWVS